MGLNLSTVSGQVLSDVCPHSCHCSGHPAFCRSFSKNPAPAVVDCHCQAPSPIWRLAYLGPSPKVNFTLG